MGETLFGITNDITPAGAAFIGGLVGTTLTYVIICSIIFYIIYIIAIWKIFVKAGEKGWKALIPIYNVYIMFKIVKMKTWFWYLIFMWICASIMIAFDGYYNGGITTQEQIMNFDYTNHPMTLAALIIEGIINIIAVIIYVYRMAKVFGKGIGFAILMFFFPHICWFILGFGKAEYNKKNLKKS